MGIEFARAVFELREEKVRGILETGRARAAAVGEPEPEGPAPDVVEMVALYRSGISTERLCEIAALRKGATASRLETFSPLYLTNTCDAECRMCGMRRDNDELERDTASLAEIRAQLRILRERGIAAVALLTGEYRREARRWAIALAREALGEALALGFRHVLVNIGSLDEEELDELLREVPRDRAGRIVPKLTMCTFQETYDRRAYTRFMGRTPENPRADFDRRLTNFDRAAAAGMRVVNPGVLLGLDREVDAELAAVTLHVRYLLDRDLEVYLSLPRLRQAAGARNGRGVTDEDFVRLVAVLSLGLPGAKIVITTREPAEIQRRVLPMVSVLSAGSSAVAPYTETGARFPLEASQFEVIDQRPFEAVLQEHIDRGITFENYVQR